MTTPYNNDQMFQHLGLDRSTSARFSNAKHLSQTIIVNRGKLLLTPKRVVRLILRCKAQTKTPSGLTCHYADPTQ